ncbi:MAG: PQQ-dependent sugar dehydrogenase [Elusimicrobia bacterium]|nr:PQQ-dependent sugar dehydrogenase [Elusimicrobiota bacterium]
MAFLIAVLLFNVTVSAAPPAITMKTVATGFKHPVSLKFDSSGKAYIVEQKGYVRVIENGRPDKKPFLDLNRKVTRFLSASSEQGLFDIALHPDFLKNGRLFAHYTDKNGDTVIAEYKAAGGQADASTERVLLRQQQPYSNHNGGQIEFGPDGYLYIALGDGGSRGDPQGNAQKLTTLLGKILRLDVSTPVQYTVPPSNPLADEAKDNPGIKPEIWAFGLRNPWRFSFDGRFLYIGDVGQNKWEEIDVEDTRQGGGKNYGWNIMEGLECYKSKECDPAGLTPPVHVYPLYEQGDCSVTGGYVYRGPDTKLQGIYFYADYCSGTLRSFRHKNGKTTEHKEWRELNPDGKHWEKISALGRDPEGEIYLVDHERGSILKLVP